MGPFIQSVFACLAVFAIWRITLSIRSGHIYSRGVEFDLAESPIAFSMVLFVHLMIAAFCIWCAAGYDPVAFFQAIGIPAG